MLKILKQQLKIKFIKIFIFAKITKIDNFELILFYQEVVLKNDKKNQ